MSLILALVTLHASQKRDKHGHRLIESRVAHMDTGPESPFVLPSELREQNSPPPDVQAPATSTTNTRSRHTRT